MLPASFRPSADILLTAAGLTQYGNSQSTQTYSPAYRMKSSAFFYDSTHLTCIPQ